MAITQGMKQNGAQSVVYYLNTTTVLGQTVVDGVNADWSQLKPGKLKDVLNRTYAASGGDSAVQVFLAAFAEAGGSVEIVGNSYCECRWNITAGFPALLADITDGQAGCVRISVAYSASE